MPTIRVDPEVFEGLQRLAKPFVDSPSAVIRRLLEDKGVLPGRSEASQPARPRAAGAGLESPAAALTPQPVYEAYLLWALASRLDGRAHKRDATHEVVKRMMQDGHIGAADQELVATGETKAENTITWARNALKERGLISRTAPRGIWELTPEGTQAAQKVVLPRR
jgi:predicted transcriptional regulator